MLETQKNWQTLPPHEGCFVCDNPEGRRIRFQTFWDAKRALFLAEIEFGKDCQGPPDHTHGGAQMAVLDELMGGSAWLSGHPVVAVSVKTNLEQMLPLHEAVYGEAKVVKKKERKVYTEGLIRSFDQPERVYAKSEGLFIILPQKYFSENNIQNATGPAKSWLQYADMGKAKS
jgi:acyl-coenzyme A thioesterase PaaI-like protein